MTHGGITLHTLRLLALLFIVSSVARAQVTLVPIGSHAHGNDKSTVGAAEILTYDAKHRRLLVVNGCDKTLDMLDIQDPSSPKLWKKIDLSPFGDMPTSVATSAERMAVAVCSEHVGRPGKVALFDLEGEIVDCISVGAHPDMLVFSPDGSRLLVANEGEPSDDYATDPEGSVSVISFDGPDPQIVHLGFDQWDDSQFEASVRVFGPGASPAEDFEPEFIAVADDGSRAWVTLQENNAMAIIDLEAIEIEDVVGLGFKDHSVAGCGLDGSDQDEATHITNHPILGMYQPDGIASFEVNGRTYLITANEGDVRAYDGFNEKVRCQDLQLAPEIFPSAKELQRPEQLGRLFVTRNLGDEDGDGIYERLYCFGGRSFAIWDATARLVYDSGDQLERKSLESFPRVFNSNHDANSCDINSDDRGPEPEGVVVGTVNDRQYAFVGLERPSALVVVDINDPSQPHICSIYHGSRAREEDRQHDCAPEGLCFIPAVDSPTKRALLAVAFEVSGTTVIFQIGEATLGRQAQAFE